MSIDLATLAGCDHLHPLQNLKQHRQGSHITQLRQGKLVAPYPVEKTKPTCGLAILSNLEKLLHQQIYQKSHFMSN